MEAEDQSVCLLSAPEPMLVSVVCLASNIEVEGKFLCVVAFSAFPNLSLESRVRLSVLIEKAKSVCPPVLAKV